MLDGLRGLAIVMVVASHGFYVNPNVPGWLLWVGSFIGGGAIGVQMFFVLSGFLISYPFLKAKQSGSKEAYQPGYATRRCLKIIPPYLLCVLLLSIFYTWRDGNAELLKTGMLWVTGFPHLCYVENAFLFNGSFWSLWVEIGFYILLPCCFFWLRGKSAMFSAVVISGLLLGGSLGSSFLTWTDAPAGKYYYIYLNGRFPNGLANFAWGVLFAGILATSRNRGADLRAWGKIGWLGVLTLFLALAWHAWTNQSRVSDKWVAHTVGILLAGLATFLMLFFLTNAPNPGSRLFSKSWVKYLGVVSYEWFLLHQPVIRAFRDHAGGSHGNLLIYCFIVITPMILTLIAAGLIYRFFSLPIIEWGRTRLLRHHSPPPDRHSLPPGSAK